MSAIGPTRQEISNSGGVALVAKREISTRVRSKSFIYSTIATIAVIAGYIAFVSSTSSDSEKTKVAFAPDSVALSEPLTAAGKSVDLNIINNGVLSTDDGRHAVEEGEVTAYISLNGTTTRVLVKDDVQEPVVGVLQSVVQEQTLSDLLTDAGIPPVALDRSLQENGVQAEALQPKDPESGQRLVLAIAISFLLYFAILIFGLGVAQGVVEEKSSRVVELLLATFHPWQILFGKILGIGFAGLLQLTIIASVGVGAAIASDQLTIGADAIPTVIAALVWFVLGFVMFSALLAGAGALVSRQEDVNSVTQPIIMAIVVPFIASVTLVQTNPDGFWSRLLSMLPPFAPILMPARMAVGGPLWWEVLIGVVTTLAATAIFTALASRIYSNSVLRTGARVKLKDALRSA